MASRIMIGSIEGDMKRRFVRLSFSTTNNRNKATRLFAASIIGKPERKTKRRKLMWYGKTKDGRLLTVVPYEKIVYILFTDIGGDLTYVRF